jgi:hemerythrin
MTSSIAANADSARDHFAGIHDRIHEGSLTIDRFAERVSAAAEQSEGVSATVQTMADASRGITREATSSFASSLEIDERVGDMLWHFERAGFDVSTDSIEEDADMFRMSDRYSVYTPSMDAEHSRIFSYVNAVHRCFKEGGGDDGALLRVFGDLAAYTAEHFRDEEALMRTHDYPAFAEHHAAHEELLATVGEFVEALQRGERVNPAAALNMLIHWLKHHIQHVDRNYGLFFRQKGIAV